MPDNDHDVFISYAREDGESFAAAVREGIRRDAPDISVWQDRSDLEGGLGWWQQIREALGQVQFLVLIVTPAGLRSPVVREEWRSAREQGVHIYPVIGSRAVELDFGAMPRWMSKAHFYDFDPTWPTSPEGSNPAGHELKFRREWPKFIVHLRRPDRPPRVRNLAPKPPPAYVRRPEPCDRLRDLLLSADRRNPVSVTTSLYGPGGFGKSTLAAALCHDPDVVEAFDDGILWVSLGEQPDVLNRLATVYAALTDQRPAFLDVDDALNHVRRTLEDKDCMIVLDDVWVIDHVKPFLEIGNRVAHLITTRQFSIAVETQRHPSTTGRTANVARDQSGIFPVDEMPPDESVEMLIKMLPTDPSLLPLFRALAQKLGNWPLLLELVRSAISLQVAEGASLEGALAYINQGLDEEGVSTFDQTESSERQRSASKTIEASLRFLADEDRRRYRELSIFTGGQGVPLKALEALWGVSSFRVRSLAQSLVRRSLLHYDAEHESIRLHDVVRSYLLAQLPDPPAVHARLLDAWGDPHSLPNFYAWSRIAYHLVGAGQEERLRDLLSDFDWIGAKLGAAGTAALVADYDNLPGDEGLRCVQGTLRLAAHILASEPKSLAGQLLGRISPADGGRLDRLLAQARAYRGAIWLRPMIASLTGPGSGLLRTIPTGYKDPIVAIVLTPDGKRAVTAPKDLFMPELKVWDLESGAELLSLPGHERQLLAIAITPDGKRVISAARDGLLKIWDLASGTEIISIDEPNAVNGIAMMPDGESFLTIWGPGVLTRRKVIDGTALGTVSPKFGRGPMAVTADGRRVALAAYDYTIGVWELDGATRSQCVGAHANSIHAVASIPSSQRVISASADKSLIVWDVETGERVLDLTGHTRDVVSVAVTPDGRHAVSGSNTEVRVWDLANGENTAVLPCHSSWVLAVAVTSDGGRFVTASSDRTLKVWDMREVARRRGRVEHAGPVYSVGVTPDGRRAVSASADKTLIVWDVESATPVRTLAGHNAAVSAVLVTPDGCRVISGAADGSLRVWDLEGGALLTTWAGSNEPIYSIAGTSDGTRIVTSSDEVLVWDPSDGSLLTRVDASIHHFRAAAVTPYGKVRIVYAGDSAGLFVRDMQTGRKQALIAKDEIVFVSAICVSPDGQEVFAAYESGPISVWGLTEGDKRREMKIHRLQVNALALTADGKWGVSGSGDNTVKVWEAATGEVIASFAGDGQMQACAFALDGSVIVAGDLHGRVHFLRLERPPHDVHAVAVAHTLPPQGGCEHPR